MWVEAVLSKDDLESLVAQIVPLTVRVHPDSAPDQYIELTTATNLALVADVGLRVTTQALIHWPVLGITVPITVDPLSVLIKPRVTNTPEGDALSFSLEIEHAEFAGIPAFGDQAITDKINSELGKSDVDLAWAFAAMLTHRFQIPQILEPLDSLAMKVAWGKVRITDEGIVLAISFHAHVSRHGDETLSGPSITGSSPDVPHGRALANRAPDRSGSMRKQVALLGGTALAGVGAYFVLRNVGRLGARVWKGVFRS